MNILEKFLDVIFPPVCGFCGRICQDYFCGSCKEKFENKFIYKVDNYKDKYFNEHIYVAEYEDVRKQILSYKFNGKSYMYKTFAKIILKSQKICDILKSCDIIVPVPVHKKRRKERGYDQSVLISKEISNNLINLEYAYALKKIKNNTRQSLLNKNERVFNVKNAYEIQNCERIKNKRVILFDDIFTTGNTLNECSRILKQSGAKYIIVLSLAKQPKNKETKE